jgi:hypothetical protein
VVVLGYRATCLQQQDNLRNLLDRYAGGEFAVIRGMTSMFPTTAMLQTALDREANEWILAEGPELAPRRRVVVASFVIDLVRDQYDQLHRRDGLGPFQDLPRDLREGAWSQLKPLVEWACGLLRRQPQPAPGEREWFRAATELFKDFRDPDVWTPIGVVITDHSEYGRPSGHLAHAMARFPGEPRMALDLAERFATAEGEFLYTATEIPRQQAQRLALRAWAGSTFLGDAQEHRVADLLEAERELRPLEADMALRAQVHLHLGCLAMCFAEHAIARRYFDDIEPWTKNPCVVYLAHFLRGHVDELDGRAQDAQAAYRLALGVVPHAQSSSTPLAALLWLDGRVNEAADLVSAGLSAAATTDDPWLAFDFGGGCSEWFLLDEQLHAVLR